MLLSFQQFDCCLLVFFPAYLGSFAPDFAPGFAPEIDPDTEPTGLGDLSDRGSVLPTQEF
jgi:hypothetical protein